jgi:hypothetical protein
MFMRPLSSSYAINPYGMLALLLLGLTAARADAQTALTPAPATAAQATSTSEPSEAIGERYHVELSVGAWFTMPSTALFSDSEVVTSGTTSTTVNGTSIDFKKQLGLNNKTFPGGHLTIRLAPKHKLLGEFIPINYKQSATLTGDIITSGQTYLSGQPVQSELRWNEWNAGYEYDLMTSPSGYLGAVIAVTRLNVAGGLANGAQSGTATVNIVMPGLGATGRYYVRPQVSLTGGLLAFYLPGGATSTHGHSIQIDGYATVNASKYVGVQAGYRSFIMSYVWESPLNSSSMTIGGPYLGGTLHF